MSMAETITFTSAILARCVLVQGVCLFVCIQYLLQYNAKIHALTNPRGGTGGVAYPNWSIGKWGFLRWLEATCRVKSTLHVIESPERPSFATHLTDVVGDLRSCP